MAIDMRSTTCGVKVGDIIDMRMSDIIEYKGKRSVRALIRSRSKKDTICVLADERYAGLLTARVVKINEVTRYSRPLPTGGGKMWTFTNVYVDIEDAFGEEANLVAENGKTAAATADNKQKGKTWTRPEFTTGGVNNAEEEEGNHRG